RNEKADQAMDRLSSYSPSRWFEIQGNLVTYAPDTIVEAYDLAHIADEKVYGLVENWKTMRPLAENIRAEVAAGLNPPGKDEITADFDAAGRAIEPARLNADEQDQALIRLIRAELHRTPSQALPPRIDLPGRPGGYGAG
ncbi:MAG: hypothetical protein ACLPKI_24350, partial [Streptosporangiaceae bacterium]